LGSVRVEGVCRVPYKAVVGMIVERLISSSVIVGGGVMERWWIVSIDWLVDLRLQMIVVAVVVG